jgi:hypothetical protein
MKLSRPLVLALLVLPGTALAQTITVTTAAGTAETSGSEFGFHLEACQQALQGTINQFNDFQLDWVTNSTYTYQAFWSTDSSCDASAVDDGGDDNNIPISVNSTENEITVNGETILAEVTGITSDPCDAQPPPSGTVFLCITGSGYAEEGLEDEDVTLTPFYIEFDYDMNPPPAPTGVVVSPADSELDCTWSFPYTAPPVVTTDTTAVTDTGDNADHFIVYAQEDDALTPSYTGACSYGSSDGGTEGSTDGGITGTTVDPTHWPIQFTVPTPSGETSSQAVTGLTNGHCYDVSIIAFYQDGTQGIPSPVISESPIEIFDYWRLYHAAGGADDGGLHCQSAGGGLIPLALAMGLLFVLRRRRRAG